MAMIGVLILLAVRWVFPSLSLWIVFSPFLVLAGLVFLIWVVEALYEGFKIALNIGFVIALIYLFLELFL
jgi:hypothetical protein